MTRSQKVFFKHPEVEKTLDNSWAHTYESHYIDVNTPVYIGNPQAKYSTYYACADQKLRKPFLIVAGWGPHTDKGLINNNQGWPTPLWELAHQFNQEGLIENLHDQGFDVVVVQFFPPNASIELNSILLEKVINSVNARKFQNGSYEENIIMGCSAGALATKLTLQKMEFKHLEQNGPHPHTKLFISNDGENRGANIPLGMQHAVQYLWQYEYNAFPTDYTTYALHYILNAPLSKQLLHYFYDQTGDNSSPGQGPHPLRNTYMQLHTTYNHALNSHLPGYPSFQRNISISNGSSVPAYDQTTFYTDHFPFPPEPGAIFFKQNGSMMGWVNRRYEARFLQHGTNRVFYYEFKQLFKPWKVAYEATTYNPLVLDNATGGTIIGKNPIKDIISELRSELTGSPDIENLLYYSFTPTILTHDVRNLAGNLVQGYPKYDFRTNLLMFDSELTLNYNDPIGTSSSFYGYPHLGYPNSHYSITPFDALFCWNQNTEHLTGNAKHSTDDVAIWTTMKPVLKNFIIEESEGFNVMLQNRSIGEFARPGYELRIDFEALHGIYMGEHITQKTDFLPFQILNSADVDMQAQSEIVFKPGVHILSGSALHAHIGEITCEKSSYIPWSTTHDNSLESAWPVSFSVPEPIIYPNPSQGSFAVDWDQLRIDDDIVITVLDMQGKFLFETRTVCNKSIIHDLSVGSYIVRIKNANLCYSKILVVGRY